MSTVVAINPNWRLKKTPRFNTLVQQTAAVQGTVYIPTMVYPVWDMVFEIPLLTGRIDDPTSTIAQFLGIIVATKGRSGTFLFNDPNDNAVTTYQFGTGDGSTQVFQLTRPIGTAADIVQNLNGTPSLFNNGTLLTSGYSIDDKGVVTFSAAPAAGHALTWTGQFYFMLRFKADTLSDLELFYAGAWDIKTLEFESVIR